VAAIIMAKITRSSSTVSAHFG